jgi:outer membrane protein assembly factor BamB
MLLSEYLKNIFEKVYNVQFNTNNSLNQLHMNTLRAFLVITFVVFGVSQSYSQQVAQWRGINRDGVYNETNLLKAWPEQGPELLWLTEEIGRGYAAPSILNDKILINGEIDSTSFLFAFDLKGKLLWKAPNGKEFFGDGYSSNFPGARSTPTIIDNLAYACSGKGRIACYEVSTGSEKWAVDMVKDLGGYQNEFGYAESLVVDDKNVYCFPGGSTTNIAAIDRFTGKTVWTSKALGDTTSFCSPILINLPERKILLTFSRRFLFAVDCKNGKLLWSHDLYGFKYDGERCNTPIYAKGNIYLVSAEADGKGTIKFELSPDGTSVKEIWNNKQIRNGFGGFVKLDNYLFTTIKGNYLKCIELDKGTVVDSVKVPEGSLIFADNKFICYGMNGEVDLVNYENKKLAVTGKLKINKGTKEHFSHPVVNNGILYLRHGKALMAYKIN